MKISALLYSIRQGIKSIKRNKMFSLASIATIAACIFLIGLFYSIVVNFQHIVDEAQKTLCVTVFFEETLTEEDILLVRENVEKRSDVARVDYTSSKEAWDKFKYSYFGEDSNLMEVFEDDNPLTNSASLSIYMNDISLQDNLVTYVKATEGVRQVNSSPVAANTLSDFGRLVGAVSLAIIAILLAVGVFLISNTVMIGIAVRKEEIAIMKLIGATDFFVRAPFLVEGILIGVIGAVIPLAALYLIYKNVVEYVISQFNTLTGLVILLPPNDIFKVLIPVALGIGAGIGFFGSRITLRKHLKV